MPTHLSLSQLRSALYHLSLDQAKRLRDELNQIIHDLETAPPLEAPIRVDREVIQVKRVGTTLCQLEKVRCGKEACKCAGEQGELHGPYWYAYWRVDGKLKSKYIGKTFKPEKLP